MNGRLHMCHVERWEDGLQVVISRGNTLLHCWKPGMSVSASLCLNEMILYEDAMKDFVLNVGNSVHAALDG